MTSWNPSVPKEAELSGATRILRNKEFEADFVILMSWTSWRPQVEDQSDVGLWAIGIYCVPESWLTSMEHQWVLRDLMWSCRTILGPCIDFGVLGSSRSPEKPKGVMGDLRGGLGDLKISWGSSRSPEGPQGVLCVLMRFPRIFNEFPGASSNP